MGASSVPGTAKDLLVMRRDRFHLKVAVEGFFFLVGAGGALDAPIIELGVDALQEAPVVIVEIELPSGGKLPEKARLEKMAVGNALYRGRGDGTFIDVSAEAGPFGAGWAWGGGFIDFDNDGSEDLYTPNGFISGPSLKDT